MKRKSSLPRRVGQSWGTGGAVCPWKFPPPEHCLEVDDSPALGRRLHWGLLKLNPSVVQQPNSGTSWAKPSSGCSAGISWPRPLL